MIIAVNQFKIGTHYEIWEHQLEIKVDKLKNYESYNYLGNLTFLDIICDAELIFNFDILELVILKFNNLKNKELTRFREKINTLLDSCEPIIYDNSKIEAYRLSGELQLWIKYDLAENNLIVTYGRKNLLEQYFI